MARGNNSNNSIEGVVEENRTWTSHQLAFMQWLITPPRRQDPITGDLIIRQPTTQEGLASELGVTDRTLRNWHNLTGFNDALSKMAWGTLNKKLPQIIAASVDNMTSAEGWQERIGFFRYILPALHNMQATGYLAEIETPRERATLPKPSVMALLQQQPIEVRELFATMLEGLGYIEQSSPPAETIELPVYDFERSQAKDISVGGDMPRLQSGKPPAKRSKDRKPKRRAAKL